MIALRRAGSSGPRPSTTRRALHNNVAVYDRMQLKPLTVEGREREDVLMSWDPLDAHLTSLSLRTDGAMLRDTLDPIGRAIGETSKRIEEIVRSTHTNDADILVDDGCELIENLLGAAFIVCQTQITAVLSAGVQLASYCAKKGVKFTAFAATKDAVLATGAPVMNGGVTKIQFIDAVANYFKHRDEWSAIDWSSLTGLSKRTADKIQLGGLSAGSTGNLRSAAQALGNPSYDEVHVFGNVIDAWAHDIHAQARTALGR